MVFYDGSARCAPFGRNPLPKGLKEGTGSAHRFDSIQKGKIILFWGVAMAPHVARLLEETRFQKAEKKASAPLIASI
ncbi:hypothetical protein, partial [Halalkalibacter kiskunsagensis]|uniref:hypothetical protein n=1 Tax=Halalkalibacter kiskunsagensis TaxID=1548599 RepID=UPI00300995D6